MFSNFSKHIHLLYFALLSIHILVTPCVYKSVGIISISQTEGNPNMYNVTCDISDKLIFVEDKFKKGPLIRVDCCAGPPRKKVSCLNQNQVEKDIKIYAKIIGLEISFFKLIFYKATDEYYFYVLLKCQDNKLLYFNNSFVIEYHTIYDIFLINKIKSLYFENHRPRYLCVEAELNTQSEDSIETMFCDIENDYLLLLEPKEIIRLAVGQELLLLCKNNEKM